MSDRILITGAAGFIGYHLARKYLKEGQQVMALDNLNDYYDVSLKTARLEQLRAEGLQTFYKEDVSDAHSLQAVFQEAKPNLVVHLAAQAGVRYSLENPGAYLSSNLVGFGNILECCKAGKIQHLVYASSSSVYGANTQMPFSVEDAVNHPVSLYGATKRSNELLAHAYSHSFGLATTGLRFFTVYGPWGRPDMALFLFTSRILRGEPIDVFNGGRMLRDFTYVDDIIGGIDLVLRKPPTGTNDPQPEWGPAKSSAPFRIHNIGNSNPVELMDLIHALESKLGKEANCNMLPMQTGDVPATYADISTLQEEFGFQPSTSLNDGMEAFVKWYRSFYSEEN